MRLFNSQSYSTHKKHFMGRSRFRRDFLPSPEEYYGQFFKLASTEDEWTPVLCPFHDDHNPSLSLNLDGGGFNCFACEAKGGDIVAFHMRYYGMGFIEACKDFGVWL